jgi:hypothetical protein
MTSSIRLLRKCRRKEDNAEMLRKSPQANTLAEEEVDQFQIAPHPPRRKTRLELLGQQAENTRAKHAVNDGLMEVIHRRQVALIVRLSRKSSAQEAEEAVPNLGKIQHPRMLA